MIVGTTGSRCKRPENVRHEFRRLLLESGATELHHGDCLGWDQQAHEIARDIGLMIVAHPPEIGAMRAYCDADVVLEPLPYLVRNKAIVRAAECIIAAPDGPEKLRSGTWFTIRAAKKAGRKVAIIYADNLSKEAGE